MILVFEHRSNEQRARRLIELGEANDCRLIAAYGRRLLGSALAVSDEAGARVELDAALSDFVVCGIPYRAEGPAAQA